MTTVYRVLCDSENYQHILSDTEDLVQKYNFDGYPIGDKWNPPQANSPYPLLKVGDYWNCFAGSMLFGVTYETACRTVKFLDQSCECLPFNLRDQKFFACNVTEVVNCLDKVNSKHKPDNPLWFDEYVFHPKRFSYSLFKIPDTRQSEVLCVEGLAAPEDEFKGTVEKLGLTGLIFQKLWSDEN